MRHVDGMWLVNGDWHTLRCSFGKHVCRLQSINSQPQLPRFIPAPIDLHIHGGGGADVMQGSQAIAKVLQAHASEGTGAMLATSVTAPVEQIDQFLADVATVMASPPDAGALLLGAHLEGPFIHPDKLGAQPPFATVVNVEVLERWFSTGVVKIITFAPEQDPLQVVPLLCSRYGVKAQMGHTLCSWAQACQAIKAGVGVTHLFNAMSGVKHRCGGAATASLAYANYAEIITDGIHVDRAAFDLAFRAIPNLYSVTDATAAAGMPDGQYRLGSLDIEKRGDSVLLPDGTLAGSCLTQRQSISVLRNWGKSWSDIADLCSGRPARWLDEQHLGLIAEGALANWLEIDDNQPAALWRNGERRAFDTTV